MNKIFFRYIATNVIFPFLASTIFFVSFLLTFQLFKVTALVINKGVSLIVVFELMYHIAITFVPIAVPLSALFATIFAMGKMSEDSEIIIMRSAGLSIQKIFFPVLILGLLIGAVTFEANSSIIPKSKKEFKKIITILTSKGFVADIKSSNFYTEIPNITIFSDEVINEGELLKNVFIHTNDKNLQNERIIFAKEGSLAKKEDIETGVVDIRLKLIDGNILQKNSKKAETEKILFKTYDFPIPTTDISGKFVTREGMKSTKELYKLINLSVEERNELEVSQKEYVKSKVEFWNRINTPFLCVLFVLLGFALGINNARGKRRNSSSLSLVIIAGYYVLFFLGMSLAQKEIIPGVVAVFTPTLIGTIIAIYYYRQLQWV
jgi:lipopolysaccharide export system permease protein